VKIYPVEATRSYRRTDRRQPWRSQCSLFAILGTCPKQVI